MKDIMEALLEKLDKTSSMMGKTNLLQVCTNLTAICHNAKSTPKAVVDTFWEVMEQVLKKHNFNW